MHAHIPSSPLDGLDCLARNIKNKVKDEKWRARLLFFFFLEEVIVFVHCSFCLMFLYVIGALEGVKVDKELLGLEICTGYSWTAFASTTPMLGGGVFWFILGLQ